MKTIVMIAAHGSGASIKSGDKYGRDGKHVSDYVRALIETAYKGHHHMVNLLEIPTGGIHCSYWGPLRAVELNKATRTLMRMDDRPDAVVWCGFSKGAYGIVRELNDLARYDDMRWILDRSWPVLVDVQRTLLDKSDDTIELDYPFMAKGRGEYARQALDKVKAFSVGGAYALTNIETTLVTSTGLWGGEFAHAVRGGDNPHNYIRHSTPAREMYKRVVADMLKTIGV